VILCIDEGTSGTRAALVDAQGVVRCEAYEALRIDAPRPGTVEQDAHEILDKTLAVCRASIAGARRENKRIRALGISTQRSSAVLWDARTGRALVPVMVWQDTRYADELAELARSWDEALVGRTGRPAGARSPYLWAARHLRETKIVAEAFERRRLRFGTIDSWLLWHLSTQGVVVTTPTNACSSGAYLMSSHAYYEDWIAALGFPRELLPELREDASDLGRTKKALLDIDVPILACMGDQHAGAIGLGCIDRSQALCVHGTGSFLNVITGPEMITGPEGQAPDEARGGTLRVVARRARGLSHFAVESSVPATGAALNWLCERLRWFDDASQIDALASTVRSAGGVVFIPALTGLRAPRLAPAARASLSGIAMSTERAELAFAILEGIAHSAATCLELSEATAGIEVEELVVGGGLTASASLLQMQANVTGLPIRTVRGSDTASLRGVALMVGSSGLFWDSLGAALTVLTTDAVFEPAMSEDARMACRRRWTARVDDELRHAGDAAATTSAKETRAC